MGPLDAPPGRNERKSGQFHPGRPCRYYHSERLPMVSSLEETRKEGGYGIARMFLDGRFYFWVCLVIVGFVYVSGVLCGRAMPFYSHNEGYGDFVKILISAPFLFYFGARHTLEPSTGSWRNAAKRNMLGFALPFFIALHWFYLQSIPQINYSLTPQDLMRMHPVGKAVFIGAGLLILGLAVYHFVLAHRENILVKYACALVGAIGLLAAVSWVLRDHYYVHIHHYFLFGFFIPFARFRNPVSLVCQALCAGVFVEGVSEWSMGALWYAY
jgi:hypothetical protein